MEESHVRATVTHCLLVVAENVAKHTIQRSGWHQDDECFVADLRDAEAELMALVERCVRDAVAAEREACATVASSHNTISHGLVYPEVIAQEIRARGQEAAS